MYKIKLTDNRDEVIKNEEKESELELTQNIRKVILNIGKKGCKLCLQLIDIRSIRTDNNSSNIHVSGYRCGYTGGSCYFDEKFEELNNTIATDSEIGFYIKSYQRASIVKLSHNNLGGDSNKFTSGGA